MGRVTSLIDFIEARLAEDESAAQAAGGDTWQIDSGSWLVSNSHGPVVYDEGKPSEEQADHIARHDPARVLREVAAKRAILASESSVTLPEWHPDCGGDWVLSGDGFFANYWPDNTVSASITDGFDGPTLAESGIVSKDSRAACQSFAEGWVREHLPQRSAVLRTLAAIWSEHPDYLEEWAA